MLDETTDATLAGAGWFPGRDVVIDHWTAQLRLEGIEVHPAAEAFLREFGGLVVEQKGQGRSRA